MSSGTTETKTPVKMIWKFVVNDPPYRANERHHRCVGGVQVDVRLEEGIPEHRQRDHRNRRDGHLHQRHEDAPEVTHPAGAVELRRLLQLRGHLVDRGGEDHGGERAALDEDQHEGAQLREGSCGCPAGRCPAPGRSAYCTRRNWGMMMSTVGMTIWSR